MNDLTTSETAPPEKPQPRITKCAAPYWQHAKDEKLVLPYCGECEASFYYPRLWCPTCFNQDISWKQLSGKGKVYSYSIIYQSPLPSYQGDLPYVLAIIELDEGPHMMANVLNCDVDTVSVDMAVEVLFEDRGDMKIPQFQPTK